MTRDEVKLHPKLNSILERKQKKQKFRKKKKPQEAGSKTKSTEDKINSDAKAPEIANEDLCHTK